jgi:hypothetical protein
MTISFYLQYQKVSFPSDQTPTVVIAAIPDTVGVDYSWASCTAAGERINSGSSASMCSGST